MSGFISRLYKGFFTKKKITFNRLCKKQTGKKKTTSLSQKKNGTNIVTFYGNVLIHIHGKNSDGSVWFDFLSPLSKDLISQERIQNTGNNVEA